jgi:transcriptional regulator with XRE-family HTH domain
MKRLRLPSFTELGSPMDMQLKRAKSVGRSTRPQGKLRSRAKSPTRAALNASADQPRFGAKLKHARLVRGLRLTDLAAMTGLSESLISKIENDKATPSLHTFHLLARALGSNIAAFFSEEKGSYKMIMRRGQRPVLNRLGAVNTDAERTETELLIPFGAKSLLQATLVRIRPGGGNLGFAKLREHQGDEVGYVLRGEITLAIGEEEYELAEGDAFFFPSSLPHGVCNHGERVAEIIWVSTPPSL